MSDGRMNACVRPSTNCARLHVCSAFRVSLTGRSKRRDERLGLLAEDGGVLGLVLDNAGCPFQEEILVVFTDLHGLRKLLKRLREVRTV